MSAYSYSQLEALWVQAGGQKAAAPIAAAIALAESGGNPTIANKQGVPAFGLWQINIAANANPQYSQAQVLNPLGNAKAAVAISKNGTNWIPWQAFTNGSWSKFVQGLVAVTPTGAPNLTAGLPASQVKSGEPDITQGPGGSLTSAVSTIGSVADAIKWIFSNWLRILEFVGGAVLGIFGLVLLGKAGAKEV